MRTVNKQRAKYPNALLVLWASLECTNFSKAKGGQARDADSRTLSVWFFLNYFFLSVGN
jgi:DNA (cytosine-5)-methyltransferase 1